LNGIELYICNPTSSTLDKRKAAVTDILKAMDDAPNWELALGCAAGVVAGFESTFSKDSPVVASLVSAIEGTNRRSPKTRRRTLLNCAPAPLLP